MAAPDLRRYLSRSLDVLVPIVLVEVLNRARVNLRAVADNLDTDAVRTQVTLAQQLDVALKRLDVELIVAVVLARVIQHRARHPQTRNLRRGGSGVRRGGFQRS